MADDCPPDSWHLEARLMGLVQRVGFRWYVYELASVGNISGHVRNLPDGSLEIAATGSRATLESLLEKSREGPPSARVDHVEVTWSHLNEPPAATRFEMRT